MRSYGSSGRTVKIRDLQDNTVLDLKRASDDFETEIKGVGLSEADQAYIDSLPRVETKSSKTKKLSLSLWKRTPRRKDSTGFPIRN